MKRGEVTRRDTIAARIRELEARGEQSYLLSHARKEWALGNYDDAARDLDRLEGWRRIRP